MGSSNGLDRRRFVHVCAGFGLAGAVVEQLWAAAGEGPITRETLAAAESLAGIELTDSERDLALAGLEELRQDYLKLREVALGNPVAPALRFDPEVPGALTRHPAPGRRLSADRTTALPDDEEEIAFLPAVELGRHVRARRISSRELTALYLDRLRRFDPQLQCVITLTEERALEAAQRADAEIERGLWRGPLHGVPWGAKDLLAVRGYPTTWGAGPYRDQAIDEDATVVRRLDEAGAVLVAKLTLGELAWGDVWFGGTTRNPWKLEQGSSGSSAGPAAATAAGLVGFAIGSETWGSIVSPSTRCGATGLRPTFGRVSRHGAMALSWSMDKLGPIGRSVEDCALVFEAIHGADGLDPTAVDRPYAWDAELDLARLRIGCLRSLFEREPEPEEDEDPARLREAHALDLAALDALRSLGIEPVPIELPDLPVGSLSFILSVEAAAAFSELTLSNRDDELVRQVDQAWPNVLRQARTIPAVEYLQANRVRTLLMRETARAFAEVDVVVAPSFTGDTLLLTNLTGHPAVVVPDGFAADGTPTSITFLGRLYGEAETLAVARAYQEATGFHLRHPVLRAGGVGNGNGSLVPRS
jgi:Asp-tRNA(Asn)/Glu-tRNA(Gln) amidotransferase A subunit family amidase